jgi:hypothetical protein
MRLYILINSNSAEHRPSPSKYFLWVNECHTYNESGRRASSAGPASAATDAERLFRAGLLDELATERPVGAPLPLDAFALNATGAFLGAGAGATRDLLDFLSFSSIAASSPLWLLCEDNC